MLQQPQQQQCHQAHHHHQPSLPFYHDHCHHYHRHMLSLESSGSLPLTQTRTQSPLSSPSSSRTTVPFAIPFATMDGTRQTTTPSSKYLSNAMTISASTVSRCDGTSATIPPAPPTPAAAYPPWPTKNLWPLHYLLEAAEAVARLS
jgi:hypothetical protein